MPWILPVPKHFFFLKYSTIGKAKARVFPDPVKSLTMTSFLAKMVLKEEYWTGKSWLIPLFFRPSTVLAWISGKFENAPSSSTSFSY